MPKIRVGFVLLPRFTLTAFAGFVDVLRLAADSGDRSRQHLCTWSILGKPDDSITASCGAVLKVQERMVEPERFDYIVVVGGLMDGGQRVPWDIYAFLRLAAQRGTKLIGLCTGSFVLARAGLLNGYLVCVSWFHHEQFADEFPGARAVSTRMFIVDRDRLTCAGGTSVVHLAAWIVEKSIDRTSAAKALRILIEEQPLPSQALQPAELLSERSTDTTVHKVMLQIERQLQTPLSVESLSGGVGLSKRQLERRFLSDIGMGPAEYRRKLRLERARWLLGHSDLSVTEIALECGFADGADFGRAARKAFGASPVKLRRDYHSIGK